MNEKYELISRHIGFEDLFGLNVSVYKEKCSNTKVFAKCIVPIADGKEFGIAPDELQEITLQHEFKHENVLGLLEYVHDDIKQNVYLVYEYFEFNLKQFMQKRGKLGHPLIKKLLYQILSGLAYLHGIERVHNQIRPENIIVGSDGETCKIADLRLVGIYDMPPCRKEMDACYRAPEVMLDLYDKIYCDEQKYACDVWSVGSIFMEMLDGKAMTSSNIDVERVREMLSIGPKLSCNTTERWENLVDGYERMADIEHVDLRERFRYLEDAEFDLLSKMLCANPNERITSSDALKHEYFKDFFDGQDNNSTKVAAFQLLNSFYPVGCSE